MKKEGKGPLKEQKLFPFLLSFWTYKQQQQYTQPCSVPRQGPNSMKILCRFWPTSNNQNSEHMKTAKQYNTWWSLEVLVGPYWGWKLCSRSNVKLEYCIFIDFWDNGFFFVKWKNGPKVLRCDIRALQCVQILLGLFAGRLHDGFPKAVNERIGFLDGDSSKKAMWFLQN